MLTVSEVAARLKLHEESVRRWLRGGRLKGVRIGGGRAGYRIPESEVTRILSDSGLLPAQIPKPKTQSIKVTVDTNILNPDKMLRLEQAIAGLPIELASITVTDRERGEIWWGDATEALWDQRQRVSEVWVLGESPLGVGLIGSESDDELYETLLKIVSNGAFPKRGQRAQLLKGEQTQKRDVMILLAHTRAARDILVSEDCTAFGKQGQALRTNLQAACSTRIMTVGEFVAYCDGLRDRGNDQWQQGTD